MTEDRLKIISVQLQIVIRLLETMALSMNGIDQESIKRVDGAADVIEKILNDFC